LVQLQPDPPVARDEGASHPDSGPASNTLHGGVAQLGEHLLCKQGVIGSIPFTSTNCKDEGGRMKGGIHAASGAGEISREARSKRMGICLVLVFLKPGAVCSLTIWKKYHTTRNDVAGVRLCARTRNRGRDSEVCRLWHEWGEGLDCRYRLLPLRVRWQWEQQQALK
jgi:hypothetical protein